jgi:hypothetical protein
MESLGVAPSHPQQSRDRVFGDVDQASGGPHPAPFAQMSNDICSLCLRDLRIEPRWATALGELLAAGAATEESEPVLAIDFAPGEIPLTSETELLAFGIDTR